ncbi:MAG: hypothetical protein AB7O97_19675 [Planctomycetota bacterium]
MAARSRVRRGGALVLLGAVVLLVFGRGLGLWSGGGAAAGPDGDGDGAGGGAVPGAEPAPPRDRSLDRPLDLPMERRVERPTRPPAPPVATDAGAPFEPPAAPTGGEAPAPVARAGRGPDPSATPPSVDPAEPSAPPAAATAPGADDDRAGARTALVRSALADGRIGDALAVLERMTARGLDDAGLRGEVVQQLDARCAALVRHVDAGELLAAGAALDGLLRPPHPTAAAAVDALCAARGWPRLSAPPAVAAVPAIEPPPRLVLRDRVVALPVAADVGVDPAAAPAPRRARVVSESAAGVTVRAVGPDGVTFPQLPAFAVEPEAVTAVEAAELGLAALAAGDAVRARLWCACGLARGGAVPDRLTYLRSLLR